MHFPKTDTIYQVLATKVNNAVKLSIETYVSQFNKAHKRANWETTVHKGNISVGSEKSFQRDYPYGAFARHGAGLCTCGRHWHLRTGKNPISPRWPV